MLLSRTVYARDLNEAWWRCIRETLDYGREYTISEGSYAGQKRKELEFVYVEIEKPSTRPLVPIVPGGLPAPTHIGYVEQEYLPYLMASISSGEEQYTYGEDVEYQYSKIVEMYKRGHNTNQACFSIGSRYSVDLSSPQCLRLIDTRVMNGKLVFFVYFRSWDLFGGFPVNLAAIQLMKEGMADEIGVKDGELVAMSKGLHLYDHHWQLGMAVTGALPTVDKYDALRETDSRWREAHKGSGFKPSSFLILDGEVSLERTHIHGNEASFNMYTNPGE